MFSERADVVFVTTICLRSNFEHRKHIPVRQGKDRRHLRECVALVSGLLQRLNVSSVPLHTTAALASSHINNCCKLFYFALVPPPLPQRRTAPDSFIQEYDTIRCGDELKNWQDLPV